MHTRDDSPNVKDYKKIRRQNSFQTCAKQRQQYSEALMANFQKC